MREIKFRGKHIHSLDVNKKLDGTWIYGYLCDENYIWSDVYCGDMLVDKNTIGQYTGLKDKNGVEIYEGDIVKSYNVDYKVYFSEDRGGFVPFANDNCCGCCIDWEYTSAENCEVIGNIYDKE